MSIIIPTFVLSDLNKTWAETYVITSSAEHTNYPFPLYTNIEENIYIYTCVMYLTHLYIYLSNIYKTCAYVLRPYIFHSHIRLRNIYPLSPYVKKCGDKSIYPYKLHMNMWARLNSPVHIIKHMLASNIFYDA